jgi:Xaa-Pro aminopeptidase
MFDLGAIQKALRDFGFDGWLFYDFHGANVLARRILDFEQTALVSRRFYYMVPAEGEPVKLVHRIEPATLDHLPGKKIVYLKWEELEAGIAELVGDRKRIAMEYSPRNAIPYVSKVDGGTVDVVRGTGAEVASSGDLIQFFEATLSPEQWQSHVEVSKLCVDAFDLCWTAIAEGAGAGTPPTEMQVQKIILDHFEKHNLIPDHAPIVAVGPHSGDPHFEPYQQGDTPIAEGELVMIDLWARQDRAGAVFADYTKMGFVGASVPEKYTKVFAAVAAARDAAADLVRERFSAGRELRGWEVDDAARNVIEDAGYGQYFIHRTGHSIGEDLHGNGTHMDNLETHDNRLVLPNTLFSVEPGVYFEEFGVRSEINVFVDGSGQVHATGGVQEEILAILA